MHGKKGHTKIFVYCFNGVTDEKLYIRTQLSAFEQSDWSFTRTSVNHVETEKRDTI